VITTLDLTGLVRPHLVEMTKREDNPNSAEFRLQPLERGYGYTLGNSLRRLLLSSLRGAAVWAFRIDGVVHEHQTIPGVVEDVHQIIQRLKQLTLVLAPEVDEAVLRFKVEKAGPVYARDLEAHGAVTIQNPEQLLFTVQDDRDIAGELYVNKGRGYVEAEQHPVDRTLAVDVVRVDSIYNPVRRANFTVAETRVGQRTDYDRLTLTVETNGTISPRTRWRMPRRSRRSTSASSSTSARCRSFRANRRATAGPKAGGCVTCWAAPSTTPACRCGR